MADYFSRVRAMGFRPRTVIDVGVADGTFDLYEGFPDSRFLLIEPMVEFEPALKRICRQHNGIYEIAAAGSRKGSAQIHFGANLHGASLVAEDGGERSVPVITVDALVEQHQMKGPFVLKIDVQGAEFEVIEGSVKTLEQTEIVVLEVPLFDFSKTGITMVEAVLKMKELGFVPHDIFDGLLRPLDGALGQVDMAFVKKRGQFRDRDAWASRTQAQRRRRFDRLRQILGI